MTTEELLTTFWNSDYVLGSSAGLSGAEFTEMRKHGVVPAKFLPFLVETITGWEDPNWIPLNPVPKAPAYMEYTVGGSDVGTIFGVSPFSTAFALWMQKKGRIVKQAPNENTKELFQMGHDLEPLIARWYARKSGNTILNDSFVYQHPEYPYLLANIDRLILTPEGKVGILEVKSLTYLHKGDWQDGAIPYHYELQLRFYMMVLNAILEKIGADFRIEFGAFAAFWGANPSKDMAFPVIERNLAVEKNMIDKLQQWHQSLVDDTPPTIKGNAPQKALDAQKQALKAAPPVTGEIQLNDSVKELFENWEKYTQQKALLKAQENRCDEVITAAKSQLLEAMGNHKTAGYFDAAARRSFCVEVQYQSRSHFDKKACAQAHPDIVAQYTTTDTQPVVKIKSDY